MKETMFYPDVVVLVNDNDGIVSIKEPNISFVDIFNIIIEKFLSVLFVDGKPVKEEFLEVLSIDEFANPEGKSLPVERILRDAIKNVLYSNPKRFFAFASCDKQAFVEQSLFLNTVLNDRTILQTLLFDYYKNSKIGRSKRELEIFEELVSDASHVSLKELMNRGMGFDPKKRKIYSLWNASLQQIPAGFTISHLSGDIILPDYVDGVPVEVIGDFGKESITSVVISKKAKRIISYAFDSCKNLETVKLPDSLKTIGASAFQFCETLKTIEFPPNIKDIHSFAFYRSGLESIDLPESLASLGVMAFGCCSNLNTAKFPENFINFPDNVLNETPWLIDQQKNNGLVIINNVVISAEDTEDEIIIPEGVIGIAPCVFLGFQIKKVSFPKSLEFIGGEAFYGCNHLSSVDFSGNLKTIGKEAFQNCLKLTHISLSDGLETIGDYAFCRCVCCENLIVPDSVSEIGRDAFFDIPHIEYHGYAHNRGKTLWGAKAIN